MSVINKVHFNHLHKVWTAPTLAKEFPIEKTTHHTQDLALLNRKSTNQRKRQCSSVLSKGQHRENAIKQFVAQNRQDVSNYHSLFQPLTQSLEGNNTS